MCGPLPTPGGADDFRRLVHLIASGDPSRGSPRSVRVLWAIRWKVGDYVEASNSFRGRRAASSAVLAAPAAPDRAKRFGR
jgi:hypothetical protein